mmetsp:Transcript_75896/g.219177  ORF Transcript_75896/g.219177 Transcript_75896/m.219177 type:complete len:254 (-) Transcript_75896:588-1349(-)
MVQSPGPKNCKGSGAARRHAHGAPPEVENGPRWAAPASPGLKATAALGSFVLLGPGRNLGQQGGCKGVFADVPAGWWRGSRRAIARAQGVVATRCAHGVGPEEPADHDLDELEGRIERDARWLFGDQRGQLTPDPRVQVVARDQWRGVRALEHKLLEGDAGEDAEDRDVGDEKQGRGGPHLGHSGMHPRRSSTRREQLLLAVGIWRLTPNLDVASEDNIRRDLAVGQEDLQGWEHLFQHRPIRLHPYGVQHDH